MDRPKPHDVIDALGLPAIRMGIIRFAAQHDSVTAEQLMAELSASRTTIDRHIKPLVAAGILVERTDPTRAGARAGFNRLIWTIDRDTLVEQLAVLEAKLTGEKTAS